MNLFSVCIIAKNEEKKIQKCLEALSALPAEIVIIDTGSTDRTKEIAAQYTQCIYDFEWINDFSAARNYSIEMAQNEYVLILDCDEYIEDFDIHSIQAFIKEHPSSVGEITHRNLMGDENNQSIYVDHLDRFFSKKCYHYESSIHEQICPLGNTKYESHPINITVLHDGYFGSAQDQYEKNLRNASMLLAELNNNPLDAYMNYQLGQTYFSMGDFEKAVQYYNIALNQPLNFSSPVAQSLVNGWINCLNELHRSEEALAILPHYNELSEYADFPLLMGHVYTNMGKYVEATKEYLKAANTPKYHKEGANSYLPFYHIGIIYEALGDINMARLMFQKCGNYAPAIQKLNQL